MKMVKSCYCMQAKIEHTHSFYLVHYILWGIQTYSVRGIVTVLLTPCLTVLDSTKTVNLLLIQLKQRS